MSTIQPYAGWLSCEGQPLGSAFLVHHTGLVVTCYHVIEQAPVAALWFSTLDGQRSFHVELAGSEDRAYDLALLRPAGAQRMSALPAAGLVPFHSVPHHALFTLQGRGRVFDPRHSYDTVPASGSITGPIERDGLRLFAVRSPQLLQGMSGAAIALSADGTVCGMLSERYNPPQGQVRMRDSGWAVPAERIAALAPELMQDAFALSRVPLADQHALVALASELPLDLLIRAYKEVAGPAGRRLPPDCGAAFIVQRLAGLLVEADRAPLVELAEWAARLTPDRSLTERLGGWAIEVAARMDAAGQLTAVRRRITAALARARPAPHLLVQLRRHEIHADRYHLTMWLYHEPEHAEQCYAGQQPHDLQEVRDLLDALLAEQVVHVPGAHELTIEFVVPRELLGYGFDQWTLRADLAMERPLGMEHRVVVRDLDRLTTEVARGRWTERWRRLQACEGYRAEAIRWVLAEEAATPQVVFYAAVVNDRLRVCLALAIEPAEPATISPLLEAAANAGMPVAVWLREGGTSGFCQADLEHVLLTQGLARLPDRVLDLRQKAVARSLPEKRYGSRITLLWDDPTRPVGFMGVLAAPEGEPA